MMLHEKFFKIGIYDIVLSNFEKAEAVFSL